jgi:hypothetical protein
LRAVPRLLGLALLAALLLPPVAAADVTSSSVTAPADGALFLDDDSLAGDPQITVRGTTDGDDSDVVDVVCEAGGVETPVAGDVGVDDGAFSVSVGLETVDGRTCTLRALPDGGSGTYAPFAGPRIGVSELVEHRVAGGDNPLYDFDFSAQGIAAAFSVASAGGGALEGSTRHSAGLVGFPGGWAQTATFGARTLGGSGLRTALLVDGRFAYTPAGAQALFNDGAGGSPDSEDSAGFAPLSIARSLDPAAGRLTLTESAPLVRCPSDSVSHTAATCPAFSSTGVTLERTWELGPGGLAVVRDRFRSTSGAHTVSPDLGIGSLGGATAWAFGEGGFDVYADGATLSESLPGAPFVATRYARTSSPDGPSSAAGAIVFHTRPQALRFFSESGFDATYGTLDVPAGGVSAELRHTLTLGADVASARGAATGVADALAPPVVTIDTPGDGAVIPTDNVLVAGRVTDHDVASVSVNGAPALLAADHSFIAFVPLTRGANTLTVVATDGAGNTGQATRAVTYTEPPKERVAPAGITRTLTPARDRRPPFRFRVAGRLILPREVTVGEGCNGVLLITVRAGRKILTTRTTQLLGECSYKSGLFKWRNRKPFGPGRKKLSVGVRFTGNAALRGKTAARASFRVR